MGLQRPNVRGFTLIELLITITILSMVVAIASFSFSLFSGFWGAGRSAFADSQGRFQRWDLLTTALSDTVPWVVRGGDGAVGFYFLGREDGLTLVTNSPIFNPDRPAVIRLVTERGESGTASLYYEEAPLEKVYLRTADQQLPFRHRMLIAEGLTKISFRYLGWSSLRERLAVADGAADGAPQWAIEYDGLRANQHPERIGLTLDEFEIVFPVADRAPIGLKRLVGE